jgi:hypothetical protein
MATGEQYSAVIKIRPDVIFGANRKLKPEIDLYMKDCSLLYSDVYTDTRLDDVFWVLSTETAFKMIDIFDYICSVTKLGKQPDERLTVLEFLRERNIKNTSTFRTRHQYAIYRNESYMFNPMTHFKECYRNDLLHFGLHGVTVAEFFHKINTEDKLGVKYD